MSKPENISIPVTAEFVGHFLYIWEDGDCDQLDDDHYRVLAFIRRYTTPKKKNNDKCNHWIIIGAISCNTSGRPTPALCPRNPHIQQWQGWLREIC